NLKSIRYGEFSALRQFYSGVADLQSPPYFCQLRSKVEFTEYMEPSTPYTQPSHDRIWQFSLAVSPPHRGHDFIEPYAGFERSQCPQEPFDSLHGSGQGCRPGLRGNTILIGLWGHG